MIRDTLPDDIRKGAPGWKWRWWMWDESMFPTTDEIAAITSLNWGSDLAVAVAGADTFKFVSPDSPVPRWSPSVPRSRPQFNDWAAGRLVFLYFLKHIAVRVDLSEQLRIRRTYSQSA